MHIFKLYLSDKPAAHGFDQNYILKVHHLNCAIVLCFVHIPRFSLVRYIYVPSTSLPHNRHCPRTYFCRVLLSKRVGVSPGSLPRSGILDSKSMSNFTHFRQSQSSLKWWYQFHSTSMFDAPCPSAFLAWLGTVRLCGSLQIRWVCNFTPGFWLAFSSLLLQVSIYLCAYWLSGFFSSMNYSFR